MKNITKKDIKENSLFFWFYYLSWFRGYDSKKELNMDEVLLELFSMDMEELEKWSHSFFNFDEENIACVSGNLTEELSFQIEFHEYEILFFINDVYLGNLGGHFEAWSLTLDEIQYFQKYDFLFMLLLPMLGITEDKIDYTKNLISKNLALIPEFYSNRRYISECVVNGLVMNGDFYLDKDIGVVNNQNHSIRNIKKYPSYRDSVIVLNQVMRKEAEKNEDS